MQMEANMLSALRPALNQGPAQSFSELLPVLLGLPTWAPHALLQRTRRAFFPCPPSLSTQPHGFDGVWRWTSNIAILQIRSLAEMTGPAGSGLGPAWFLPKRPVRRASPRRCY